MRDEPNVELRRLNSQSLDTIKGVVSLRQQDGIHNSRNPLRSVFKLTCLMDQPWKWMALHCDADTRPSELLWCFDE